MAVAAGSGLIDINTGRSIGLNDNLAALGYTQDTWTGKSPTSEIGTTSTSQNTSGSQKNTTQSAQQSSSVNTTDPVLKALNDLVIQYRAGGSPNQKTVGQARVDEITRARDLQSQFSPERALAIGQGLVSKAIEDALLQVLPTITASSESAGTSKSSMRALLTQQAAEKGAVEGAAQAGQLGVQFGGLQANLEGTLNELTKGDPNSIEAQLANLIAASKGIVTNTTTTGTQVNNTSSSQNTSGSQNTQVNKSGELTYQGTTKQPLQQSNSLGTQSADSLYTPSSAAGTMAISRNDNPPGYSDYGNVFSNSDASIFAGS